jgi:hypothetical protein
MRLVSSVYFHFFNQWKYILGKEYRFTKLDLLRIHVEEKNQGILSLSLTVLGLQFSINYVK